MIPTALPDLHRIYGDVAALARGDAALVYAAWSYLCLAVGSGARE